MFSSIFWLSLCMNIHGKLTPYFMQKRRLCTADQEQDTQKGLYRDGTQFFTGLRGIASKRFRGQNFYD